MFKNYIKIAFRNLVRNSPYSLINIFGLTIGISCCMMIFMWVFDELQYDKFHEKSDEIHRILWDARFGDNSWTTPLGPVPVGDLLHNELPEVTNVTQIREDRRTFRHNDEYLIEDGLLFTDENFFNVFTVEFIEGDPETALKDPKSIVLTKESAKRYFPDGDAIGKTLEMNNGDYLMVTGIVNNFPSQSHFNFDFLASIKSHPIYLNRLDQWSSSTVYTYFVVQKDASAKELERKINTYLETTLNIDSRQSADNYSRFLIQPLNEIYLGENFSYDLSKVGNKTYVYLFSAIGLFILLLACINYINLATAYVARRSREVAVRKSTGAYRGQLTTQFLIESGLSVIIAILLAGLVIELSLPFMNEISGKDLTFFSAGVPEVLSALALLAIVIILLSGAYPAFLLASLNPMKAFKGIEHSGSRRSKLRNSLVVFQFCTAVVLITGTYIIYSQLHFFQNKNLGFDSEQVLIVENAWALKSQKNLYIQQLKSQAEILYASGAQSIPGRSFDSMTFEPEQPSNYKSTSLTTNFIDYDYAQVLNLEFVKGRNFSADFNTDSSAFLLNETAARALGWEEGPIGRKISALGGRVEGSVVGVLRDYHYQSLHHKIEPVVYMLPQWESQYIIIRLASGNISKGVSTVQEFWEKIVPEQPFQFTFLDETLTRQYNQEKQLATIINTFSILAVLIACFGLFGLTAYMAERRKKEIGVRKILGASVIQVVSLLSKDFLKLVLIGFLIAIPIAWYGMNQWLVNFQYRIEPGLGVFLISGGIILAIALLTISWQSIKAAVANPVDSLRSE